MRRRSPEALYGPKGHGAGSRAALQPRGFGSLYAGVLGGKRPGGPHFRSARKLGSEALQLILLALLAEQPRHGYALIRILEERSGGFYRPSPGMIYPALSALEADGRVSPEAEGARKRYHITASGRAYLAQQREAADAILTALERVAEELDRLREILADENTLEDGECAGRASEIQLAKRELRRALREKRDADADEARRIAGALRRAATEIRAKG